ncbi:MAG: hypothetical protein KJ066_13050 [Acidobacteria bacterium]|nr:hypothetical protein [Acidobacteriota bacterium]
MANVNKNQRVLLIVNELAKYGGSTWRPLYKFIEESGVSVGRSFLDGAYSEISVLRGASAKRSSFVTRLRNLANRSGVQAVDLFLQLHGASGHVWFYDGKVSTATLRDEILAQNLPDRLRLVYNTSCYGDSHSTHLIQAGFKTAVGSVKVNANAAVEYPTFCMQWGAGQTVEQLLPIADNPASRAAQDFSATTMGFNDVNSRKVLKGRKPLKISSKP